MAYILLSHKIDNDTPLYGNTPKLSIIPHSQISSGDSSNTSIINIHCHTGTHVDAPDHFIDGGKTISDYSLDELIFRSPIIIDVPINDNLLIMRSDVESFADILNVADCLLIRTGSELFRNDEQYRLNNIGIAPETIRWIREQYPSIRCIGIDSISISSYQHREIGREAHRAAFEDIKGSSPLLLMEDVKLGEVKKAKMVMILPWMIKGVDSTPCTVLAQIEDHK